MIVKIYRESWSFVYVLNTHSYIDMSIICVYIYIYVHACILISGFALRHDLVATLGVPICRCIC